MPRIRNIPGPYRLHFYSEDCKEPPHIHVVRDDAECKFWVAPVRLAYNKGFANAELTRIRAIILENQLAIMETWRARCG